MKDSALGKVVIITGASSGIGAAVAHRLARDGMRLALAARRLDRLQKVAAEVESLGGEALVVQTDVCDCQAFYCVVQAALEKWGRIDVLFNNAGVNPDNNTSLTSLDSEEIRKEIATNLTAVIECAQAVLTVMLRQKAGHIINVASAAGLIATSRGSIYCATKFGVNGFSDALRRELRGTGIHISVICPGFTPSEITPGLKAVAEGSPDAPNYFGLMPVAYVADQVARLIYHPRRRVVIPHSMKFLVPIANLFPGIADVLLPGFLPKGE